MASLPPVRACIFDVDGTLINSEDIYTDIYNNILREYGRPDYPWAIKATQQSRGTKVCVAQPYRFVQSVMLMLSTGYQAFTRLGTSTPHAS